MDPVRSLSSALTVNDNEKCIQIISSLDISSIDERMQRGFISLCLRFYISNNNHIEIEKIINSCNNLMKRDYLAYCKYLYDIDIEKSKIVFFENIVTKENILTSDIDFLIIHNCFELLKVLNGYYIVCSGKSMDICLDKLKKFDVLTREEEIISHFANLIISSQKKFSLEKFRKYTSFADVIIDGGNVLYSSKDKNVVNLENIISLSYQQFKNPLIIIHHRHKKLMMENDFYSKYEKNIYLSPFNVYDDYFLILGLLCNKIPIISNDKFRDHIYEIFKLFNSKNNQLSNYIKEMTLSYNETNINSPNSYSKCIQYDEDNIYVPTKNGFIEI